MSHNVWELFEDLTSIEVVVTHEGIIIDTYAEEGMVHTGTFGQTFAELHDFVLGHDAGIFPRQTQCWCGKHAKGYYGQPEPVCGEEHADVLIAKWPTVSLEEEA